MCLFSLSLLCLCVCALSSNVFHFTFKSPRVPVRKVVPSAYREAVDYLDGKRRHEKLQATLRRMEEQHQQVIGTGRGAEQNNTSTKEPGPSLSDVAAASDAVPARSTV